jgi:ubiquinol-cytochrome c reductase cytochrome b subunit
MPEPVSGRRASAARVRDWLDSRTGYRALLRHLADEPVPQNGGWYFTTGSVLMLLIGVQFATGIVLAMYYVPAPGLAYESVRYIMDDLPFGWLLRGLHFWGASFIVVAAVVHMARVFLFGSYQAPREVTWLTGVVLLLLILAFSLSGYLLPWDQKAYWATTVTVNVAGSAPLIGEYLVSLLRGGSELGALTLGRWYAGHVLLLPASLMVFVAAHLVLMRRHGISGPLTPQTAPPRPFYPWHVMKDTIAMAAVFAALVTVAWWFPAHLDEIANPVDASYVPRPEWYFLSLFELLKIFPGPLEPIGTIVIPSLVILFLIALPFVDRGGDRHPLRSRWRLTAGMLAIGGGTALLTVFGLLDRPRAYDPGDWGPQSIAGYQLVAGERNTCQRCHVTGGPASPIEETRITRDQEWLLGHMADPVALAPGVRSETDPAPPPQMTRSQAQTVLAYLRRVRAGARLPIVSAETIEAASLFSNMCAGCHAVAGEGNDAAPDLTGIAMRRDAASIRRVVVDPREEFPQTIMPAYGRILSDAQIDTLARYLLQRH